MDHANHMSRLQKMTFSAMVMAIYIVVLSIKIGRASCRERV